ncbi:hypothetical protein [Gemmata sp.]|uniref:hypothetical protein n=1 Tax=Gemmata sp. TaxID=1914242 RepID=UPI003F6EDA67
MAGQRGGGVADGKRNLLAVEVARGLSVREAAERAGVKLRTAERWASDPTFTARVAQLRSGLVEEALTKVTGSIGEAVDTLRRLLDHEEAGSKLKAAVALLTQAVRLREHGELVERLERLERASAERGPSR